MQVLVLNCGSSSIKYQLIDMSGDLVKAKGVVAKIGEPGSYVESEVGGFKTEQSVPISNHAQGLRTILGQLTDEDHGALHDTSEISAIGHRVVHGGDRFTNSALINTEVIEGIRKCVLLAPLHNPHNLAGIEAASELFKGVPQVAVFDTSFHQTLPEKAFLYPIPYEFYTKYHVRKFGFHGTSCKYVSRRAAVILGRRQDELSLIVCHLGNGVTVDAIRRGKSVDTSMGLTPVEGLMMGTRSGDVDPGVIYYISKAADLTLDQMYDMLNTKSGLLGISGVSNDMREVIEQAEAGSQRCKLAMEMFAYRVTKYIGSCASVLDGVDAIVFTAGIGSNSPVIRSMICASLGYLGVKLDQMKNQSAVGIESDLSGHGARVRVLAIPTNEELQIALDTQEIVSKLVR